MGVRAVWHSELKLDDSGEDPFAERIEDVGVPIVIGADGDEAKLQRALLSTVNAEGRLAAQGVLCEIKRSPETSCHACPLFRADDSALAALCAIGRQQERL